MSLSALCQLMSISSCHPIRINCLHGNLEVRKVSFDTMDLNRSLLLSQPIGRFILPELSLFDAVKSLLLGLLGLTFSPHPSLTQWPLSVMPTLVFLSGGLDLLCRIAL